METPQEMEQLIERLRAEAVVWDSVKDPATATVHNGSSIATLMNRAGDALSAALAREQALQQELEDERLAAEARQ